MEKFLNPNHPVRCIIAGPSNSGKTILLTNLIINFINEFEKLYIFSPSIHQDLYQKLIKFLSNYIPTNMIKCIQNKEDLDLVIDDVINHEDFAKSDFEIESYDSMEELKYPQEYENYGIIILDDLGEKELNDSRVQALFKRSRHKNLSIFLISQDYYELPKRTIRANANIYHIFKPNNFRDVLSLHEDKSSMDILLNEFRLLTSTCWNENYQALTIDMTKDKYKVRYRLALNSIFVPDSNPF